MTPFILALLTKLTLILALGVLAAAIFRSASPSLRHLILFASIASCVVLPLVIWMSPQWNVAVLPRSLSTALSPANGQSSGLNSEHGQSNPLADSRALNRTTNTPPGTPGFASTGRVIDAGNTQSLSGARRALATLPVFPLVWLVGFIAVIGWLVIGRLRLRRIGSTSWPLNDSDWTTILDDERRNAGVEKHILLGSSSVVSTPLTWGWRTPVILLPEDALDWPDVHRRIVLRHELAHVARGDSFSQTAAGFVCALYWFHPLVWIAERRLRAECERACDDNVVSLGTPPAEDRFVPVSRRNLASSNPKQGALRAALFVLAVSASAASAQELPFHSPAIGNDTARSMSALANQAITEYKDANRVVYLDNLFRLQLVAGRYTDATRTLTSLRALQGGGDPRQPAATLNLYSIFARAKIARERDHSSFDSAFQRVFREALTPLDDRTSWLLERPLFVYVRALQQDFTSALEQQKGKNAISLTDALKLIRAYEAEQVIGTAATLANPIVDEDNRRRYIIDTDIPVKTPDGATICTMIVRPRAARGRLPALLTFTIYAAPAPLLLEARRAASRGYAGVVGYTRGKGCSPGTPVPYEYDGADATALIDWISAQPWNDGRVGMWGGSYSGFTQWATAKHMPKALKALMPQASAAPAIDVPMDGNLFLSFVYPWPFYTTDVKALDDSTYNNTARWNKLNHDWYVGGRSYRDLDKIDGKPNPIFDKWISHPNYDSYWQSMIPFENDFARINIPVLQTAGYYYGGPGAAVYYLTQHYKYNPAAQHYLVIGPWGHFEAQRGMVNTLDTTYVLNGYKLDRVALFDMGELRYQWFDYVFKGAPKPALLRDKVNYQVMGANIWKHAPSIAAMSNRTLRYYLIALRMGDRFRLSERNPGTNTTVTQTVNLADRTDADRISPGGGVVDTTIDTWNGVAFVSNPLQAEAEVSGLFSGRLDFITNKKDFDINISLYELTSKNEYVLLSTYWTRASAVGDLTQRRLLTSGKRESLDFKSVRLTSRVLQPGSRIIVLINVLKEPDMQINYGTGKDVSDETIADAGEPLKIEWFGDSYIDLPIWR